MALWINHCFGPLLTNINGNQSPLSFQQFHLYDIATNNIKEL